MCSRHIKNIDIFIGIATYLEKEKEEKSIIIKIISFFDQNCLHNQNILTARANNERKVEKYISKRFACILYLEYSGRAYVTHPHTANRIAWKCFFPMSVPMAFYLNNENFKASKTNEQNAKRNMADRQQR